jgi:cysteine-S-conjugate beta-lyase
VTAPHPWDLFDAEHFRAQGSLKWTMFPDQIPAFVAEMDFPLAPPVIEALRANLDAQRFGYLPESSAEQLCQSVVEYLDREYQWLVKPSQIMPVADVLVGYDVVLTELVPQGAPVIIPTPAYMPFLSLTPTRDHPVIEVPFLDDGGRPVLDLARIEEEFVKGAGLLILCNPHNPLGIVHTREELEALSVVIERVGGLVFADEIHAPLVFDGRHIPYQSISEEASRHAITAISASKAWNLAGLKCAQLVVTSPELRKTLLPKKFLITHGVSTPGVEASIASFRDGGPWLEEVKSYLRKNIALATSRLTEAFGEGSFRAPEGTYIGWLDLRHVDPDPHESVADYLRHEAGIALTDGAKCGEAGRGFVRIILATPTPILATVLDRLIAHVGPRA